MHATAGRAEAGVLWALAGVLWAVALLGIASIGLFLVPLAVLATVVAGKRAGGRGVVALVVTSVVVVVGLLSYQAATSGSDSGSGSAQPVATRSPSGGSPSPVFVSPSPAAPLALPAPPPLAGTTGVRLLVVQGDDLALLDVDSGEVTVVRTPPRLLGYSRINATAVGREVVLVGDDSTGAGGGGGDVLASSGGVEGSWRVIGSSDPQLIPSRRPGRIWLSSVTDSDRTTGRPRTQLTEVDLRGRVLQRIDFDGTFGATPFAGRFLRDASVEGDEGVELVDGQGVRARSWPGTRLLGVWRDRAVLVDAAPCTGGCRLMVLTSGDPLAEREVEVQDSAFVDWQVSGLSLDGRTLFSAVPTGDEPSVGIARTDLGEGAAALIDGVRSTRYFGFTPSFSADGRWMFFPDADQAHVDVHDVVEQRSYRVPGRFAGISSVVVVG